jgi:hypothetical protein
MRSLGMRFSSSLDVPPACAAVRPFLTRLLQPLAL